MDIVLYGKQGSGSAAIEAALELAGLPVRVVETATWDRNEAYDELLKLNPLGQIPTLVLPGGAAISESAAILIHLGLAHPREDPLPQLRSRGRRFEQPDPAVGRRRAADEAPGLELVHDGRHVGGVAGERFGQGVHRHPFARVEVAQRRGLLERQPELAGDDEHPLLVRHQEIEEGLGRLPRGARDVGSPGAGRGGCRNFGTGLARFWHGDSVTQIVKRNNNFS